MCKSITFIPQIYKNLNLPIKIFSAIAGVCLGLSISAQDIHFSQFYASPLSLNPANTGNHAGDWRVSNNFRRQWKSITVPFVTASLGYDRQFYLRNHNLSGGVYYINDKSGDSRLTVNKLYLSGAYHKKIDGHNLHGGLQAGYVKKGFDISQLSFPDQFDIDQGQFNTGLSTGDAGIGDNLSYMDLNIGLAWSKKLSDKFEPQAGLALFHLTKPNESFTGTKNNLPRRKVLTLGARWDATQKIFLTPHVLMMSQIKANDFLTGTNVGYNLPANEIKAESVFAGVLFRNGIKRNTDAFIVIGGINFKNLSVGLSYDYNISDLKVASDRKGAIEFSIIYTSISTILEKIALPCDRY